MIVLRKILAAPILIVLALLSAFVSFLVCVVAAVGFAACVILVLLALVLLVTGKRWVRRCFWCWRSLPRRLDCRQLLLGWLMDLTRSGTL